MKAEQAAYWRFVRQMPLVAVEALDEDILVVTRSRKKIIVEIKVSIADLRHDITKSKHSAIRKVLGLPYLENQKECWWSRPQDYVPHSFYFAVPSRIWNTPKAKEIFETMYPYAGVISVIENVATIPGRGSMVVKPAIILRKNKLTLFAITKYVKAQSASLANAYAHLARREQNDAVSVPEQQRNTMDEAQLQCGE